jgi:hypothetical protein
MCIQVDLGSAGGPGNKISRFSLGPVECVRGWNGAVSLVSHHEWANLDCKPRYKRRAGELNAYWVFCLRLNEVHRGQDESGVKAALSWTGF